MSLSSQAKLAGLKWEADHDHLLSRTRATNDCPTWAHLQTLAYQTKDTQSHERHTCTWTKQAKRP
jgi:hypothetical protein